MRRRQSNAIQYSDEDASKLMSSASPDQNPLTSKFSKLQLVDGKQRMNNPSDMEQRDTNQAYKQVQQNLIIGES